MTTEEIVASIAYHFAMGAPDLSTSQMAEHKRRGVCPACENGMQVEPIVAARGTIYPDGPDEVAGGPEHDPYNPIGN